MKCFNSLLISFWVYPILIFFVFILGIAHSIIRLSLLNWIYTSQTLIAYDSAPLTSLVAQTVKHLPTMWEAWVWSLGWENPLEKKGYPLQYFGLDNSMDYIVYLVAKSSPSNSPGQNTGIGSLSLLQGIFPTQVSHIAGEVFTSLAAREA